MVEDYAHGFVNHNRKFVIKCEFNRLFMT